MSLDDEKYHSLYFIGLTHLRNRTHYDKACGSKSYFNQQMVWCYWSSVQLRKSYFI